MKYEVEEIAKKDITCLFFANYKKKDNIMQSIWKYPSSNKKYWSQLSLNSIQIQKIMLKCQLINLQG